MVFYKSFSTDYKYTRLGRITDVSGLEKALGSENATITFSKKLTLNKTKLSLKTGDTFKLKLDGISAKKVSWKSSDKTIAAISKTGTITAKKKGTATITAIYKKEKYKCRVTVA